jgi:hypothetical protein
MVGVGIHAALQHDPLYSVWGWGGRRSKAVEGGNTGRAVETGLPGRLQKVRRKRKTASTVSDMLKG